MVNVAGCCIPHCARVGLLNAADMFSVFLRLLCFSFLFQPLWIWGTTWWRCRKARWRGVRGAANLVPVRTPRAVAGGPSLATCARCPSGRSATWSGTCVPTLGSGALRVYTAGASSLKSLASSATCCFTRARSHSDAISALWASSRRGTWSNICAPTPGTCDLPYATAPLRHLKMECHCFLLVFHVCVKVSLEWPKNGQEMELLESIFSTSV